MRLVYLDNAATTQVCRAAADKALEMMTVITATPPLCTGWGVGRTGVKRRANRCQLLGCSPETLFFTSAALNPITCGFRRRIGKTARGQAYRYRGRAFSVLESVNELERQGCEVTRLVPDKTG